MVVVVRLRLNITTLHSGPLSVMMLPFAGSSWHNILDFITDFEWTSLVLISQQSDQAGVHHNLPTITQKETSSSAEIFWRIWYVLSNEEARLCTLSESVPENIKFLQHFIYSWKYSVYPSSPSEYFHSILFKFSFLIWVWQGGRQGVIPGDDPTTVFTLCTGWWQILTNLQPGASCQTSQPSKHLQAGGLRWEETKLGWMITGEISQPDLLAPSSHQLSIYLANWEQ